MRYSSLKLLYYISEASGFSRSSKSVGPSPSVEALTKTKPGIPMPKSSGTKKIYPGVDPRVLGKNNKEGQLAAEAGEFANNLRLIPGKELKGAGTAAITTGELALELSRSFNAPAILQAEVDAQQEGVRSMSNVSNFYKNLGGAPVSPLRPKSSLIQSITDLLKTPKP